MKKTIFEKLFNKIGYIKKEEFDFKLKDYKKQIQELSETIVLYNKTNYDLTNENIILKEKNKKQKSQFEKMKALNEDISDKLKKALGAKGDLIKQINKKDKEIADLRQKLDDSMTDKYLVRHIPAEKPPKIRRVYRSSKVQSKIVKDIHEN